MNTPTPKITRFAPTSKKFMPRGTNRKKRTAIRRKWLTTSASPIRMSPRRRISRRSTTRRNTNHRPATVAVPIRATAAAAISSAVTAVEIVAETAVVDAGAADVAVVGADIREDRAVAICLLRNMLLPKVVNATTGDTSRAAIAAVTTSAAHAATLAATGRKAAAMASPALLQAQPVQLKTIFFSRANRSQNSVIVRRLPHQ